MITEMKARNERMFGSMFLSTVPFTGDDTNITKYIIIAVVAVVLVGAMIVLSRGGKGNGDDKAGKDAGADSTKKKETKEDSDSE